MQKLQPQQPKELENKKGFRKGERKAYRTERAVIVEEAGHVVKEIEVEEPTRDYTATLYMEAQA